MKWVVLVCLFCCGCAPEKPTVQNLTRDDSAAVLELGGERITLAEFERRLAALPPEATQELQTIDQKRAYLEYVAQFEALVDHAEKVGYQTDPRAVFAAKRAVVKIVELSEVSVDEAALQEEVDDAVSRQRAPEKRRVSVFTSDDVARCAALRESLRSLETVSARFDAFSRYATQFSSHESARRGGNLGIVFADEKPPYSEAAFNASLGEVVDVTVETGCALVIASGVVPSAPPDRNAIETELRKKRQREAIDKLRGGTAP